MCLYLFRVSLGRVRGKDMTNHLLGCNAEVDCSLTLSYKMMGHAKKEQTNEGWRSQRRRLESKQLLQSI